MYVKKLKSFSFASYQKPLRNYNLKHTIDFKSGQFFFKIFSY
jgi:hypothetical protein